MTNTGKVASNLISEALSSDFLYGPKRRRVWGAFLGTAWKWLTLHSRDVLARGVTRRLKVAETVSLGEKRFVSILQVDGDQFLVGGSPSNIVLLARLEAKADAVRVGSFESALSRVESKPKGPEVNSESLSEVMSD